MVTLKSPFEYVGSLGVPSIVWEKTNQGKGWWEVLGNQSYCLICSEIQGRDTFFFFEKSVIFFSNHPRVTKHLSCLNPSLLSGEFRFFGPSIHVSSALRLCGNSSCELSQGKLLGMAIFWATGDVCEKSIKCTKHIFWLMVHNFWWKWIQTLFCVSIFCLIICVFDMVQILTIWEDACTLRNKD